MVDINHFATIKSINRSDRRLQGKLEELCHWDSFIENYKPWGINDGRSFYIHGNMCEPFHYIHYNDVILGAKASQITSLTLVYSTVYQTQIKEHITAPSHWPLCGEFTGDDDFIAQMASSAENVSIWWRNHDNCWSATFTHVAVLNVCNISANVTSSHIDWAHTKNNPCIHIYTLLKENLQKEPKYFLYTYNNATNYRCYMNPPLDNSITLNLLQLFHNSAFCESGNRRNIKIIIVKDTNYHLLCDQHICRSI